MFVRYCGNYVLTDLENFRLSVARVSTFNDPFELHLMKGDELTENSLRLLLSRMIKGSPTFREGLLKMHPHIKTLTYKGLPPDVRKSLTKNAFESQANQIELARKRVVDTNEAHCRVMCFCERKPNDPFEILMWAYYAEGHKGVRLHLAPEFLRQKGNSVIKILYPKQPPKIHLHLHPLVDKKRFDAIMDKVFKSKSRVWKHEQETRLLIDVDKCFKMKDPTGTLREYTEVKPPDVLRIDLGVNYTESALRVAALRKLYPNAVVYRAVKRGDSYALDYEKIAPV